MPRATQGGAYEARGKIFLRVTIAPGQRRAERMPWVTPEQWGSHNPDAAPCPCVGCRRGRTVQTQVNRYRDGGADLEMLEALVKSAAPADDEKMAAIARAVEGFCEGKIPKAKPSLETVRDTFRGVGKRWTSGELARLYPDHVQEKRSARDDGYRLDIICETGIGDLPVASLTVERVEEALRAVDAVRARRAKGKVVKPLDAGGRRQHAQLVNRILQMAAYPLRLIPANPMPRGWLPRVPNDKAKGLVYPNEEAAFLADADHPIHWRIFFGALTRMGFRTDEESGLTIANVDIERVIVTLDENKTDDPRAPTYKEVPGFVEALKWWKETYRSGAGPDEPFFIQPNGQRVNPFKLAELYRTMLEATLRKRGLYRSELFVGGDRRLRLRAHDLRGAFVTYALANGRTETWVMDRTGHRSSQMVNRYRRVARTVAEAELGDLTPLAVAIPEVAAAKAAAEVAAEPKVVDEISLTKYRNDNGNGLIAQLVEQRTFNP